jgi:molybdopterin synthase catalytic subunit
VTPFVHQPRHVVDRGTTSSGDGCLPDGVVRLVAIRDEPLDVTEVMDAVEHEAAGGLAIFVGRVRDHDHGMPVAGLDYSAHPQALQRLRAVCVEVAARHDVRAIAAVHAVGQLDVGSLAVVVAAAADHRGTAFEAARDLIDTVKSEVPIWKHQAFGDGTHEWVGTP